MDSMLIESFIQGKKGSMAECEDGLVITDHFIGVIDGVTSKSDYRYDGMTTGQLATKLAIACISSFAPDIDAYEAVRKLTQAFRQFYVDHGRLELAERHVSERLAACAVIYSRHRREIWLVGDCQCLVDGAYYSSPKLVDTIIAQARALYVAAELKAGKTVEQLLEHDTSREYVLPLIKLGASFANCQDDDEYGYAVIDGFDVCPTQIRVITLGDESWEVVLASDGYPRLFPSLEQSEQYLQKILTTDPLCYREYKSTKGLVKGNTSFDDRAYVRFIVPSKNDG